MYLTVSCPEHEYMPAVSQRLIDRCHTAGEELVAGIRELYEGSGNLCTCCLKELLVVYHVIVCGGIVICQTVVLAVHTGLLCRELAVCGHPGLA